MGGGSDPPDFECPCGAFWCYIDIAEFVPVLELLQN